MDREYDREKWLYVPDYYTDYRYILGIRGDNPLICIGINPSTAEPDNLDNTLKSVERIAFGNGYKSWVMFNVYAQRSTDPNGMHAEMDRELHEANMAEFEKLISGIERPSLWAAWGTIIEKRPYLTDCLSDMTRIGRNAGAQWLCAGKCSKKGHPHHPLYLKKDELLKPFDIEQYLNCSAEQNISVHF